MFKSYLNNRRQCVKIGDTVSDETVVDCGVPQGTVLGPLLFTVYVNEIFNLPSKGEIISFADDTAIFYKDISWTKLKETVEKDLQLIKNWFDYKLLTVNYNKTKYITFTCHNYNLPTFDNIQIITQNRTSIVVEPADSIKYLGVPIHRQTRKMEYTY